MAASTTPIAGVNLGQIVLSTDPTYLRPHKLGTLVQADDGKAYVWAQANATISANTAVCAVNTSTFLVAATGGAYTSPSTALASGDQAWFSKASV